MQGVDPHRLAAVQLERGRLVTSPVYWTELGSFRYFLSGKAVQVSAACCCAIGFDLERLTGCLPFVSKGAVATF